jgi:1-acyl-sn-glycerol-3-phosphate acyltransferase
VSGHLDRAAIVAAITGFLADRDPTTLAALRASVERVLDEAGDSGVTAMARALAVAGRDWDYYAPDPLARRIHHVLADRLLEAGSRFEGTEHLDALAGQPVVIVANHLSYSDANLIEVLLARAGGAAEALAGRLTAIAGPKVYSSRTRRFSSLCFGTIKVAQSSGRSSEDAVMTPRDVARAARRSIDTAHARLAAGDALLVFAEGSRSRTTGLQRLLAGVARYLDVPGTQILPMGVTGTDGLFPIGEDGLHPSVVVVRAGPPIDAGELREAADGNRQLIVDTIGFAIADLLPESHRGAYADADVDRDEDARADRGDDPLF